VSRRCLLKSPSQHRRHLHDPHHLLSFRAATRYLDTTSSLAHLASLAVFTLSFHCNDNTVVRMQCKRCNEVDEEISYRNYWPIRSWFQVKRVAFHFVGGAVGERS
jgi:hypothetical protein